MPLPLVVDTDCGVDDALALLVLLGSPDVDVRAITAVHGTGPVEQVARNVQVVLELAGRPDIPVYQGAPRPLLRETSYSPHVHGQNGLGDVEITRPAGAPKGLAIDLYRALEERVTLFTLGPLTNVALALAAVPRLATRIDRIVAMGGALFIPGTFNAVAESNIGKDPEAAAAVLGAGVPLTLVPMDLVRQVVLTSADLASLADKGPHGAFASQITGTYLAFHKAQRGIDGIVPADAVTATYLLRPDLFRTEELYLEVDCGWTFNAGKTIAHATRPIGRGNKATVVTEVDVPAARALLLERLAR